MNTEWKHMKIGDRFLCIKDVVMDGGGNEIAYIKGKIYKSEMDDCLTDESGIKNHYWTDSLEVAEIVPEYFKKLPRNKRSRVDLYLKIKNQN